MLSVRGVDIVSAVVGQSEKALADVFDRARSAAPCVMLLDQLETLAPPRGPRLTATQARLLSCLVAELDRCPRGAGGVAVLATVGSTALCDESIFGAGRLECIVELPGPEAAQGLGELLSEGESCAVCACMNFLLVRHSCFRTSTAVLRHRVATRLRVADDVTDAVLQLLADRCCATRSAASICACCDEAAMAALRESMDAPAVARRHLEMAFGAREA